MRFPPVSSALSRRLYSISPLLPFYLLGLLPGQVLWPAVFTPLILGANFVWALIIATLMVVVLGETERVGQSFLLRYAFWATVAGLIINIGHDISLSWLNVRVDFLLEKQPWRLLSSSYALPCLLLFVYHWLLSWQYLRLRVWQAALMGVAFAALTAPWTTLVAIDFGQGRLPTSAQRVLWLGLAVAALAILLFAVATAVLRRAKVVRSMGRGLAVAVLALLLAAGGVRLWLQATSTPAIGLTAVSGTMGDLAFAVNNRVYAVHADSSPVRSLGTLRGDVVAWSPDGRQLLVNEQRADGTTAVAVVSTSGGDAAQTVGAGKAAPGAWSPDSRTILYVRPTETSSEIRIADRDGRNDRLLAEGTSPSWSPDGRRIAYSARTAGRWQVWAMLPTGEDPIQLTSEGGEDPIWSPDGRLIAYTQNNRVHVMDADGLNKRRLPVDSAYADVRPLLSWCSDSSRLAYTYVYPVESGRPTQVLVWETTAAAIPLSGGLLPLSTPTTAGVRSINRSGDYRPPFSWSSDGQWLGFLRQGDLWAISVRTGEEQRLVAADSFVWGGRPATLVVRPVPTYPPTPTPTPLPPAVVESPAVLALDPRDAAIIYAGTASGVIRKSGAGGWFLSSAGISFPTRVQALVFDPTDSAIMYAGTDGQRAVAGMLYKSVDGGNRWTATGLRDVDVYSVAIDAQQPKNLYAGTSKGVYASSDGGATWSQRNNGLKTTTALAVAIDASGSANRGTPAATGPVLYLGTRQGEVYKSINGGNEWRLVQTLNAPVTSVVVYARRSVTVFATTESGLFSSTDGGETWNQVSGGIWKVNLDGLTPSAKDSTVYSYGVQGVFVSHDGGVNWGPASTGLEGTQPSAMVAHPTDPSLLYVGTDKGVYSTSNGGVTWSP